jgi:hypothetical protein
VNFMRRFSHKWGIFFLQLREKKREK